MKQRKEEGDGFDFESKTKEVVTWPTPPSLPKFRVYLRPRAEESVTKREIAKFWRQKRIEEEDHLFAAIKAAARLRARNLSEQEEYWSFELFLKTYLDEDETKEEMDKRVAVENECKKDEKDKEVRVGIKDWWTKSKYAYLNQPSLDSMDPSKKRTYVPNYLSYQPKALYPTRYWCLLSHRRHSNIVG